MVLFIFGGLTSSFTSVRGDAFEISIFSTLPIRWIQLVAAHLSIGYIVVTLVSLHR
jgi:hypothetical protein